MRSALTIRQKYWASVAVWFVVGPLLALVATAVSPWIWMLVLGLMAGLGIYTMNLRCPKCNHPVLRGALGEFWGVKSWVPQSCVKCGAQLP
jgi:hypothetical protein